MKTITFATFYLVAFIGFAQQKSTGDVALASNMFVNLTLDNSTSEATIVFKGPSDRWFALQFGIFGNKGGMVNGQDFFYANNTTLIDGNMIGEVVPLNDQIQDWNITSNTVSAGQRTIVAKRSFSTGNADDYIFNYNNSNIDFAWARSFNADYSMTSYHGSLNRGYVVNTPLAAVLNNIEDYSLRTSTIYPNPSVGSFIIESKTKLEKINVYSHIGEFLKSVNASDQPYRVELDLKNLPKGTYLLELQTGIEKIWKKIILE